MANDFLVSWRSPELSGGATIQAPSMPGKEGVGLVAADTEDERHRTVGVSMSPALRKEALARARALGLPFSRYVAWCVEAELEGRPPQARFDRSSRSG
jgi:hypothetical protein